LTVPFDEKAKLNGNLTTLQMHPKIIEMAKKVIFTKLLYDEVKKKYLYIELDF